MVAVHLNTYHMFATTRYQLERDTTSTRKQVEGVDTFEIDIAVQYIKNVLLGKIGGRACLERAGDIKMSPLIDTSNNSHRPRDIKVIKS